MDVVAFLVTELEAAMLVKPAFRPFDNPPMDAQTAAVGGPAACDDGLDAAFAEQLAVRVRVVSPVAKELIRPEAWPSGFAADGRHAVDHGNQLRQVMAVGRRDRVGQGNPPGGIHQQRVFRAVFPSVHGTRSRFFPRCAARTEVESTTARDQSILPAPWSLFSSTRCKRSHTPPFFQSRSRRQQLMPEPQPISCGRYSQGMPVLSTNRMPVSGKRWRSFRHVITSQSGGPATPWCFPGPWRGTGA